MPEEMNSDGVTNNENLVEENNGDRVVGETEGNIGDSVMDGEGGGDENGEDLVRGEEEDQEIDEDPEEEEKEEDGDDDDDAEEEKESEVAEEEKENEEDVEEGKKSDEDGMTTKESEDDVREGKTNEHNVVEVIEKKEGAEQQDANNLKNNENSEKKVDGNSAVVKKARKRNRKKKVTQRVLNEVLSNDGNNPESSDKKKVLKKLVSKDEDKPESSGKKKKSKKVESMGMIFMCTSQTKKDCYRYKLLGLPAGKKDIVEKIYKGMRLFLFDLDLRLMYGIYKAAGPGGSNIEPKAFKSAFPSQVRFTIFEDCLPLAEEKFKNVIKENYYSRNKFHCELNSEQVKNLCKLFVSTSKASAKSLVVVGRTSEGQTKSMHQGRDEKRGLKQRDRRNEERGRKRRNRDEERGGRRLDRDEEQARKRRGRRQERNSPLRQEQRIHERPITYANEVFSSQVAPLHRGYQLPAPSYVYERSLEVNPYRHEPLVDHRGLRLVDLEPRHHDETKTLDPYLSYREIEAPLHRRPVYTLASEQREYYSPAVLPTAYVPREADRRTISGIQDYYQPESLPSEYLPVRREVDYRTTTGLPADYHSTRTLPSEYHGSRSLLAEYRAAGLPTEDLAQTRSAGYRRVGPAAEYPSAGTGALRDYHSLRSTHRY